ncbi:MAG TPA: restriction endonuclease subunit S [Tepidisphaeraceae bacterium]|nr:restriction endonuclease subunit S [Tepidisphaeraceae bacterium]
MKFAAGAVEFDRLYSAPKYALKSLDSIIRYAQYGTSQLASEEQIGVPVLRMNNLQRDGWDLTDLKYVDLPTHEVERYRLNPGDILFNRTNSAELVGKCEVFGEPGTWVYASYLIRVVVDDAQTTPEFVSAFLNTKAGRLQIDRVSRPIAGMSNINAEELRALQIPLPPDVETQRELAQELDAARASRNSKLNDASDLLRGLDGYLVEQLQVPPATSSDRQTYAVRLGALRDAGRANAAYFHPERLLAIKAMQQERAGIRTTRLDVIADFARDLTDRSASEFYLGLASVQSDTGELLATNEDVQGQCFEFRENDILFARLRPYLNKVHRAERAGICSPEFHVIRIRPAVDPRDEVLPDYLAVALRSSLILNQTKHMTTGNTHPRLANDDVVGLVVPIPLPAVQRDIVDEVERRRSRARDLREQAEREWQQAKERFEHRLLGKEGNR